MNNARYFAWMDIGRLDLLNRSGMFSVMKRNNWFPVVADEKISFGKSLDLFDSVLLETKLHGWDAKNFYIQQQFKKKGKLGNVKRESCQTKGPLETSEILETLYDSITQYLYVAYRMEKFEAFSIRKNKKEIESCVYCRKI